MNRILAAILAVLLLSGAAWAMSDFLKKRLIFGFYGVPVVSTGAGDALLIEGTTDKLLIEGTTDALLIE